jgi:hypothetical protein
MSRNGARKIGQTRGELRQDRPRWTPPAPRREWPHPARRSAPRPARAFGGRRLRQGLKHRHRLAGSVSDAARALSA